MIRPVTCITMLLAAGSGLYLFQAKHQGYVLDRQIDAVVQDTGKIHAHIAVLRAEYALMNDPSRLQQLAGTYLPELVPPAPGQFTTLADLDSRLPPVARPAPPPVPVATVAAVDPAVMAAAASPVAAAQAVAAATPAAATPAAATPAAPPPPMPVPALVASLAAPAAPPAPAPDAPANPAPRPAAPPRRIVRVAAAARPHRVAAAAARPDPWAIQAASPPMPSQPQQGGSVLGMARSLAVPAYATFQRYRPGASETLAP